MLNGGMTPWDYYQGALQNAQRGTALDNQNAELAARMQMLRAQQVRQQMLAGQQAQLLPMRLALMHAQADRAQAAAHHYDPQSGAAEAPSGPQIPTPPSAQILEPMPSLESILSMPSLTSEQRASLLAYQKAVAAYQNNQPTSPAVLPEPADPEMPVSQVVDPQIAPAPQKN